MAGERYTIPALGGVEVELIREFGDSSVFARIPDVGLVMLPKVALEPVKKHPSQRRGADRLMATTPRISALIEALQQEMEAHGDLPVLGYATAIETEYSEIDLARNDDGEEPVMLLILDGPAVPAAAAKAMAAGEAAQDEQAARAVEGWPPPWPADLTMPDAGHVSSDQASRR